MSHWTDVKTQIKDRPSLIAACQAMGIPVLENSIARGYGANKLKAELVLCMKGPYDIACNRAPDGTYTLTTDWWGGHVEKEVGKNYGMLTQHYGVQRTVQLARSKGHMARTITKSNGELAVQITGV